MKNIFLPFLGVILFISIVGYFSNNISKFGTPENPSKETVEISINGNVVVAEIANSPGEREQGLSGREALCETCGMLFDFTDVSNKRPNFWMKDMNFPIDIIWISSDKKIVQIDGDVPPPEPGANNRDLVLYTPESAIEYVLEVNAGFAQEKELMVGDSVEISEN